MKIVEHQDLAGKNLLGCLCPEANYLPYWHMVVEEDLAAEYEFRPHCTGHNVGRWWNAMLRLQACTGFDIPSDIEAAMLENTWRLSDNPTGILLEDPDPASEGSLQPDGDGCPASRRLFHLGGDVVIYGVNIAPRPGRCEGCSAPLRVW